MTEYRTQEVVVSNSEKDKVMRQFQAKGWEWVSSNSRSDSETWVIVFRKEREKPL